VSRRPFVVNASPLIFLARIDQLPLLWRLAEEVLIPSTVVREVLAGQDLPPALVRIEELPDLRIAQGRR
jgi:predicted nucleic acid-binding protein